MSDERAPKPPRPNRQGEVAQEIFARERGANRAMPFSEFLLLVEAKVRVQMEEERELERRREDRRRQRRDLGPGEEERRQEDRRQTPG